MKPQPGLMSGYHEQRKHGWARKSHTWDGDKWIPSAEYDTNWSKGLYNRGFRQWNTLKTTVGKVVGGIDGVLDSFIPSKEELPTELHAGIDFMEQTAQMPVKGAVNLYKALPEDARNAIANSFTKATEYGDQALINYSHALNVHPGWLATGTAAAEMFGPGAAKKTGTFLKDVKGVLAISGTNRGLQLARAGSGGVVSQADNTLFQSLNKIDANIPTVYKAELLPPPVKTAELGPYPTKRSEGSALIKRQQDKFKSPEQLKLERKKFTETYNIATQGPLKHHHKGDQYFAGKVANRTDSSTVFKMLEDQEGIVLGDKAQNIIGLADQKTYLRRTSAMESVSTQMGFKQLPKTGTAERRLLDDLFKETKGNQKFVTPKDPASYGLPRGEPTGTNTWSIGLNPDGSKVTNAQKLAAYENRFKYNKIDKSKIKYDRGGTIVSGDHIDLAHYTGIDSKDFTQRTELIKLFESGEHLKLSSLQLKNKITEVYRIQENIAVNVAVRRMKFIKDYVRNSGNIPPATRRMLLNDPNKLREWIVNNPGISGNIGWKLKNPTFKELSRTPSSQYLKEWRSGESPLQIIFGKGASISRPKGWVERATSKQINKLKQNVNQKRL